MVRVWAWFIGLLALYAIVTLIVPLLGPFTAQTKLDVTLPEAGHLTPQRFETYLHTHGFDQIMVEQRESNDAGHNLILIMTETRSLWPAKNERLLDRLLPMLEAKSVKRGDFSVTFEPPERRDLSLGLMLTLTIAIGAFLLWQQRSSSYVSADSGRNLSMRHFLLAALTSLPLALVLLVLLNNTGAVDSSNSVAFEPHWQTLIGIVLLIPLIEEVIFRAWLLDAWSRLMSPTLALVLSAILFSVVHPLGFTGNTIFLLPGLLWGYLWLRYQSLALCTTAHASYNAIALVIILHQG